MLDHAIESNGFIVPTSPVISYIELTNKCNNRCRGCGAFCIKGKKEGFLDAGQWGKIFNKLVSQISYLCLTGGEPTLYPELEEIFVIINDLSIPFSLFTNGRWPNPEKLIDLLQRSDRLIEIFVSLHGPDTESHDAFTGIRGSFMETCENVRRCASASLPIAIDTIITSNNFNRIGDMVQLAHNLGAKSITFSRYITACDDFLTPSQEQLISAMDVIGDQAGQACIPLLTSVCIPKCFHPSGFFNGCLAGTISLTINPFGDVRPCVMAPLVCGNLLEQCLADIWKSEIFKSWRSMVPPSCLSCSALSECLGGCRAAAMMRGYEKDYLMTKPILEKDYSAKKEITLSAESRPVGQYAVRKEPFGYLLISGQRVAPVNEEAMTVLEACNGEATLGDIYNDFGQEGIDFLATLYRQGLVELY